MNCTEYSKNDLEKSKLECFICKKWISECFFINKDFIAVEPASKWAFDEIDEPYYYTVCTKCYHTTDIFLHNINKINKKELPLLINHSNFFIKNAVINLMGDY